MQFTAQCYDSPGELTGLWPCLPEEEGHLAPVGTVFLECGVGTMEDWDAKTEKSWTLQSKQWANEWARENGLQRDKIGAGEMMQRCHGARFWGPTEPEKAVLVLEFSSLEAQKLTLILTLRWGQSG